MTAIPQTSATPAPTTTSPPTSAEHRGAPSPPPLSETVAVRPWPDPVIDTLGHDPRSLYVETFWLPTLGPTTLLLLRHLAHRFDEIGARPTDPGVIELPVAATAQALGLAPRDGQNAPVRRGLERLAQFDLAYPHTDGSVAVRRSVPPVSRRHVRRLPPHLRGEHEEWLRQQPAPDAAAVRRARRIAVTMVELGTDVDVAERALHGIGFRPAVCREAATWAHARHRAAERGGDLGTAPNADLPDVA